MSNWVPCAYEPIFHPSRVGWCYWIYRHFESVIHDKHSSFKPFLCTMPSVVDEQDTTQEPTVNEEELYGVDLTEAQDGGVRKRILVEGKQEESAIGQGCTVTVRYVGRFLDGEVFDSNLTGEPFQFGLGEGIFALVLSEKNSLNYSQRIEKTWQIHEVVSGFHLWVSHALT